MNHESVESFVEEFMNRMRNGGLDALVQVDITPVSDQAGVVSLDRIESKSKYNSGYAERAMKLLVCLADDWKYTIELTVRALNDSTDQERLASWYLRHGFVCSQVTSQDGHLMLRASH